MGKIEKIYQELERLYDSEAISKWLDTLSEEPDKSLEEELQRYQDELYDFKVFAAKQAKEHHISFVHDFEWHNFCAGLLSYFKQNEEEKK